MPLLGSSFAILKPAKMQISVKIGVIQFWNAYEFVIISTTRTIFGYVVLHSVLKTFGVGVDIKLFYQSILDKKVADTQETYYDGAQALYDLRFDLGGARTLSVGRPVLSCWSGYLRCGGRGLLWDSGSKARCSRQRRRSGPHPAATGSTRI